jgi:hypothetical protein
MRKANDNEPHWEPLPRRPISPMQVAVGIVRNAIPLAGVLFFGWSAGQFLLISVFNIAFSVTCIGVVGAMVSTRKEKGEADTAGEITGWLTALAVATGMSLLLTAMFGWVIVVLTAANGQRLFTPSLGWAAFTMIAAVAPMVLDQYRADIASDLTEAERKKRDSPNVITLIVCAGIIFIVSGYAAELGRFGLVVMVLFVSALFLLRDLRPDLMRELSRPRNMPPPPEYGEAGRNHNFLQLLWRGITTPANPPEDPAKPVVKARGSGATRERSP